MSLVGNQKGYLILNLSHYNLLSYVKLSEYITEMKFDKDPLVVEQNNYSTKTVNVYIVHNLHAWPRNNYKQFQI